MIALLLRLYPPTWRQRYGEEFTALLEERPLSPFDVADVLLGALDARLRARGRWARHAFWNGSAMSLRVGGVSAILAGSLWLMGFMVSAGLGGGGATLGAIALMAGTVSLLVALVGLSSFQARTHPRLVWAAFTLPAVGCVLSIVGLGGMGMLGDRPMVADLSPWDIWFIGVFTGIAGTVLFAAATWRTRSLSRLATSLLGVGSGALVITMGAGLLGLFGETGGQLTLPAVVAFALGWIALGIDAIGIDRRVKLGTLTV